MADLEKQLRDDRAMRDTARQLVTNSVENLRGDLAEKGLAARFAQRMKEGAEGVVEETSAFAKANPGRVGSAASLGLGLLLAWLFREPLGNLIDTLWTFEEDAVPSPDQLEDHDETEAEADSAPSEELEYDTGEPR